MLKGEREMMPDLLLDALLLMILWLSTMLLWMWRRRQATTSQADHRSAKRSTRRLQDPKPFLGLTTKPCCPACEHAPPPALQRSSCPPPLPRSPRGRRPQVAAPQHYCPTPECAYYGWTGLGNLRANGHPSGGPWRQWHCLVCGGYFLETHGTFFHGKRVSPEQLVWAVGALAEGLGIRAVARVVEVDPNTVLQWLVEAADHLTVFSQSFLHDVRVTQVQLDELYARLSAVKDGEVREAEALARLSRSPHWVWVAMDPVSKLRLTIDVGKRAVAMAPWIVHQLVQVLAPDGVPLFMTDGFKEYATALLTHFGPWVQPSRRQAMGPAPRPRWMPLPQLVVLKNPAASIVGHIYIGCILGDTMS
jgi:hypothetical protein